MKNKTKKNIINTSYTLFKENGYDATTINQICKECQITKTTFYRHISSKEDLLTYYFDSINDELGHLIVDMTNADNYYEQILCAFDLIINRMNHFGKELYAQLYITNLKNDAGTFDEIPVLKDILLVLIKKAQDASQIHNQSDPSALYEICSTLCFGCGIKWCLGLTNDLHDDFIKSIAATLEVDDKYNKTIE